MHTVSRRSPEETRRRIIDAAFDSFADRGYQSTTMAGVAEAAGVAEQTMYFVFGSKAALLREVMIHRRGPAGGPTRIVDQDWVADVANAPSGRRAFAIISEHGTEVFRRLAPVADAMTAAGLTDPDVAEFLDVVGSERRAGMSRVIATIASKEPIVVSEKDATDILDVVQSMTTYNAFVRDCGWPTERYKAWAYRTLTQLLPLATPRRARALDAAATADLSFHEELASLDAAHQTTKKAPR